MSYRKRLEDHLKKADGETVLRFRSRLPEEYDVLLRKWIELHEQFLQTTQGLNAIAERVAATRPDLQYKAGLQKEVVDQSEVLFKKLRTAFLSFRLRMRRDQEGNRIEKFPYED